MKRRSRGPERLEPRRLLAADPLHVGIVYLETDYLETDLDVGSDSRGDRFILSFTGGAPDTELQEVRIRTDKDGDGISVGDPIYDTKVGGRGKRGAHGFEIVRVVTDDGHTVNASVAVDDGGQELVLQLSNFRAGDRLEFTIDVDEVLRNSADLDVFNDRLDVITSGQEFQDSILEATFNAPHYETSHADAIFLNDYGDPAQIHGLNLPPDEGPDIDSRPNRSAAAVGSVVQVPKPVEISGHVWLDNDLDASREPGEQLLAGVEIALWREDSSGTYRDTGHRATTGTDGSYLFAKSLGLQPGQYRLVETQPAGLFSVASVPGTVNGITEGTSESRDILTDIELPLGDLSAVNFDFAEAAPASISGFVYQDDDNDGLRENGEQGISGVRVRLVPLNTISPQSALIATTDGNGFYSFTGLAPGAYEVIELDQPVDVNDGIDSAGRVGGTVVGVAKNPGDAIHSIVLSGADVGTEYNFGEVPFGSIAGFVYLANPGEDCSGDHSISDSTPLPGVEIALQDERGLIIASTVTGTDGGYTFDGVPVGNYRIVEYTPVGLIDGDSHTGLIDDVRVGENVNGGLIQNITMTPGGIGIAYNFCESSPVSISGYVYHDQSNDGRRDAGEAPIRDASVTLVDVDGREIATVETDSDGRYEFADLPPGEYSVVETQPSGYLDGIDRPGTVRGSSVGRVSGADRLSGIRLNQGDDAVEYNFGELLGASLSGRVHADSDGDCELDPGEETLAGVTIRIFDELGNEVASTLTGSDGRYSFHGLRPGTYTVVEEQPEGYFEGKAKAGSVGGDVIGGSRIGNITLASGENAVEYDFCERPGAEISGTVYNDRDADCRRDAGEPGIEGVVVELYDESGQRIGRALTDAAGNYRFTNLPAGTYTVRETQPTGWLHGGQDAGSAGGNDSNDDVISEIPISWGDRLTQYDFCELEPSGISGIVFVDGNGDCIRDEGEPPLAGVTVELRDAGGRLIDSTVTDATGRYSFNNLGPGQYQVREIQPSGYFHGGQTPGTGDGQVLGPDLLGVTLLAGERLVEYNFCEEAPSSIRGFVYVDDDGDCEYDPNEEPLDGVAIELRDDAGRVVARTTTNAQGMYHFEGLSSGTYEVFEEQPDGVFQGGQRVGTGNGVVLGEDLLGVDLLTGQHVVDYNFCELPPSTIEGSVWEEVDFNQTFDPGEIPVPGVLVELIDSSGDVVSQTRTNGQGNYRFDALAPGIYSVRETQPGNLFHGGQVVGDLGGEVGEDDLLIGIALQGGTNGTGYDFPEVPPATISGFVFQDGPAIALGEEPAAETLRDYSDGQLTPDDTRLAGVTLELRNVLGQPYDASRALPGRYDDGPIRTTTDAEGYYEFVGLRPGTYHVYEVQPENYIDGLDSPGSTGGTAVNPADEPTDDERIMIQTLTFNEQTDPRDDAILNISLSSGATSENNNFSEVVIADSPVPPLEFSKSVDPPRVTVPIETFDPTIRVVTFAEPTNLRSRVYDMDEWAVSWHLSVINGGFPIEKIGEDGIIRNASARTSQAWTREDHAKGRWSLASSESLSRNNRDRNSTSIVLGEEGAIALAGDFDGDGTDEAVIYVAGQWFVDLNGNGEWDAGDLWIKLGTALDRPVVGDWDGDGKDDVGIFGRQWQRDPQKIKRDHGLRDPSNKRRRTQDPNEVADKGEDRGEDRPRYLQRSNQGDLRADAVDHVFKYGEQVDTPIVGDWNGDGIDQIAIFRSGKWTLDADGDGRWTSHDHKADFGRPGDEPIVGDFNGDSIDDIGVVRGDTWIIDTDGDRRITGNDLRIVVPRESSDSQPVVGDFDGDGVDEPGYYDESA
ncbi:MAG: MSCRAMM family protein [Rubripirellula sp.]